MTWPEVAAEHLNHRMYLRAADHLECVDCSRKLLIPLRPDLAPTPTPPPFQPPTDGRTMPGWFRDRVLADIAARRKTEDRHD